MHMTNFPLGFGTSSSPAWIIKMVFASTKNQPKEKVMKKGSVVPSSPLELQKTEDYNEFEESDILNSNF